jgi:hypothetical protein
MFASASPIHNFEDDLFGYGEFARTLATGVVNRTNITEPYVIGIDASWGMGKTSATNLIRKAFQDIAAQNPSDTQRVHVVLFSPWLVSSLDALAISYIGELTGALDKSFGHRLGEDWSKFKKRLLKRFGRLVSVSSGAVGQYRSVRENDSIADFDQAQLREFAVRSLEQHYFPRGLEDPDHIEIAKSLLRAYVTPSD